MKKILLTLFACLSLADIEAQHLPDVMDIIHQRREQINDIDNQVLYRIYISSFGYGLGSGNGASEWWGILYFDSLGILRKSKLMYSFEIEGYYIRYFTPNGVAFHALFHQASGYDGEYSAIRYLYDDGKPLCVDFIRRDSELDGLIVEHVNYVNPGAFDFPMPQIDGETYDNVMNINGFTDEIKQRFDIDSIIGCVPEYCTPVRFIKPRIGDETFVCQNNVPFYPAISKFVEPIHKLSVGHEVFVIGVIDNWYKVKYQNQEGYISAEFLSPVEQVITK